jgi:hypothetical protein
VKISLDIIHILFILSLYIDIKNKGEDDVKRNYDRRRDKSGIGKAKKDESSISKGTEFNCRLYLQNSKWVTGCSWAEKANNRIFKPREKK